MEAPYKNESLPNGDTHRRVVVVDDNVWMQRIITKILLSYNFEPVICNDGYEAIARAVDLQPVAIILDIVLPEINGYQVLRMLKSMERTKSIPVLMVTVASDTESVAQSLQCGAADYIRKPFSRTIIFDKLRTLLGDNLLNEHHAKSFDEIHDVQVENALVRSKYPPNSSETESLVDSTKQLPAESSTNNKSNRQRTLSHDSSKPIDIAPQSSVKNISSIPSTNSSHPSTPQHHLPTTQDALHKAYESHRIPTKQSLQEILNKSIRKEEK